MSTEPNTLFALYKGKFSFLLSSVRAAQKPRQPFQAGELGFDQLLDLGDRRGEGFEEALFSFDLAQVPVAAQRAEAAQREDPVEVGDKLFCRGRYQDNILVKPLC